MADTPLTDSVQSRLGAALVGAALTVFAARVAVGNLRLPARDGWVVPLTLCLLTMSLLC